MQHMKTLQELIERRDEVYAKRTKMKLTNGHLNALEYSDLVSESIELNKLIMEMETK